MKNFIVALLALMLGFVLMAEDADAKGRVGGGRTVGTQRQMTTPQNTATPPAQQAQPSATNTTSSPAAPQPSGAGRWLGPLAGLAAGLGLGWLISHDGSGVLGTILMVVLGGVAVMFLLRFLSRNQTPAAQTAGAGGYAGQPIATPPLQFSADSNPQAQRENRGPATSGIPLGFDTEGFLKEAKRNFVSVQEANDRGDLAFLREVATPEMFDIMQDDIRTRTEPQQTDVVALNASLLEIATENGAHWASVRFSGSIREDAGALPSPVEEIWHLRKPADDSSGWQLAGIQQVS